jgi:hypothetical protein
VSLRLAALALMAAAVLLYAAAALPLRAQVGTAAEEYRRLQDEQRTQQARLAGLERRESRQRALATAASSSSRQDVLRAARLAMVRSLDHTSLKEVRLALGESGTRSAVAVVQLSAQGTFDDVVRASGDVIRPGSGLVLASVRMRPHREAVDLSLDALVLGARP